MKDVLFLKIPTIVVRRKIILKEFDFSFPTSSVIAIVGPNGAGKTTLLKALLEPSVHGGLICKLDNINLQALSRSRYSEYVSYLGSSDFSQSLVSVEDFIESSAYRRELDRLRVKEELEYWGLNLISRQSVSELSLGQFQRLLLLVTFLHDAKLYLLDEPERHLDPQGRKLLLSKIKEQRESGKTILFATHDLDLAVNASEYFLGLDACGQKEFSSDKEILIKGKLLDSLFGTSFEYVEKGKDIRVLS